MTRAHGHPPASLAGNRRAAVGHAPRLQADTAAVVRRVSRHPASPGPLAVGAPNDAFEQEADQVAARVMRMTEPGIQRTCTACQKEMDGEQVVRRMCSACEETIQAKSDATGTGPAPPGFTSGFAALRGGGRPLSGADRAFFEPRFGRDFSTVRLHSGPAASELARSISARAFTLGDAIVLGEGERGRELLAHELTHVVQQGGAAQRVQRRGTVARPVRPPRARLGIPNRYDNSFEAMLQRATMRDYAERIRIQQERPIATLTRGGQAPDFITVVRTRTHTWLGGPGGGSSVQVRDRRFHLLDAIEFAVSRANSEADLERILDAYVPGVGLAFRAIELLHGRRRSASPVLGLRLTAFWDDPLIPDDFDPAAEERLQVFEQAVRRRAQTVPQLAASSLLPQTQRRRGCRLVPTDPSGDDPLSNLYCHMATGSPYSYRIYIESPDGAATRRWAEIDALRGNTWYECKCGYEALLTGAARGDGVARAVLDRLDHQVLNHQHIARECGLDYRYIVSNDRVADILRGRWFGNVVVDVVRFQPCD